MCISLYVRQMPVWSERTLLSGMRPSRSIFLGIFSAHCGVLLGYYVTVIICTVPSAPHFLYLAFLLRGRTADLFFACSYQFPAIVHAAVRLIYVRFLALETMSPGETITLW